MSEKSIEPGKESSSRDSSFRSSFLTQSHQATKKDGLIQFAPIRVIRSLCFRILCAGAVVVNLQVASRRVPHSSRESAQFPHGPDPRAITRNHTGMKEDDLGKLVASTLRGKDGLSRVIVGNSERILHGLVTLREKTPIVELHAKTPSYQGIADCYAPRLESGEEGPRSDLSNRLVPVDNSLIFINFMNRLRAKRTDSLTNRFFLLSIRPV